jgi:Protein of unknown function (DUF2752)
MIHPAPVSPAASDDKTGPAHDHDLAPSWPAPAARAAWVTPAVVGAAALGACVLLAVRDPNQPGSYGACPFKAMTGLDCPGCGMLRGTHALFTGHPGRALDHNIFLPLIFVLGIVGYVRWARRSLGHPVRERRVPPWLIVAGGVVALTFWVVRNLGGPFDYLASDA